MTQKAAPSQEIVICFVPLIPHGGKLSEYFQPRDRYLVGGVIPQLVTDHKITPLYLQVIAGHWGEAGEGGGTLALYYDCGAVCEIAEFSPFHPGPGGAVSS